jgi:iron-sulfur cluster assembly accessory protein
LPGKSAATEGEGMITLTPVAISKIKSFMEEQKVESGLRIAVVGGGCSGFQYQMTLDKESHDGDKIINLDGFKLFIDKSSLLYLDGTKIDYVDDQNGSGFKFDNPNAKTSCGCGDTFDA